MPVKHVLKPTDMYMTCGVRDAMQTNAQFAYEIGQCTCRHFQGDWGDVCPEDAKANVQSLVDGSRIMSSYKLDSHEIWIITEAADEKGERSTTTILFPEEY